MSVGSLAISIKLPPGHVAANQDTTSSKVASLDPDPEAPSAAEAGMWIAASSTKILVGSLGKVVVGEGAGEVFVVGAAVFCADLPEPRALAALACIAVILEREGGVEGRRSGVLALGPAGVGAVVCDGAGGGLRSIPARMDLDTVLTAIVGEGTEEA